MQGQTARVADGEDDVLSAFCAFACCECLELANYVNLTSSLASEQKTSKTD